MNRLCLEFLTLRLWMVLVLAQWWQHSPPTNVARFRMWVEFIAWFSTLHREMVIVVFCYYVFLNSCSSIKLCVHFHFHVPMIVMLKILSLYEVVNIYSSAKDRYWPLFFVLPLFFEDDVLKAPELYFRFLPWTLKCVISPCSLEYFSSDPLFLRRTFRKLSFFFKNRR